MLKDIILPEIADNIVSGLVGSILVAVGDVVEEDQALVEVETDKATSQIPAEVAGTVVEIKVAEGDTVAVGATLLVIDAAAASQHPKIKAPVAQEEAQEEEEMPSKEKSVAAETPQEPRIVDVPAAPKKTGVLVAAAPSVRKFAREIGIDISEVQGTGPGARITQNDVKAHAQKVMSTSASSSASSPAAAALPDFSKWGEVRTEKFNKIREITANSMTTSWQTIPQVTQFDKADITALEDFRKVYGKQVEKGGGKLTVTSILVKVIALALKKFPNFNASVDMANKQTIYKDYYNIGIAVDTDNGLLVPVIKAADEKNLSDISAEISTHAQHARNKRLSPNDMAGGNFTISNLGGIGGTAFSPIVYAPQVAILGISRAVLEATYVNGALEPRLMMPLSLSYDHRVIDGADGARFLRWVCNALENPLSMFI
ncbi:MAG: 2-oxo acid dehydrogenase subunit E2 [Bacteroidales bacterium]|jgi:pyruvate dehydrogenase E2 component (dihydrolipoamide acetyltransferase)|nr:2-oxo acid dehydrogenase subunit E2 [Bacteroidales bacterium]